MQIIENKNKRRLAFLEHCGILPTRAKGLLIMVAIPWCLALSGLLSRPALNEQDVTVAIDKPQLTPETLARIKRMNQYMKDRAAGKNNGLLDLDTSQTQEERIEKLIANGRARRADDGSLIILPVQTAEEMKRECPECVGVEFGTWLDGPTGRTIKYSEFLPDGMAPHEYKEKYGSPFDQEWYKERERERDQESQTRQGL